MAETRARQAAEAAIGLPVSFTAPSRLRAVPPASLTKRSVVHAGDYDCTAARFVVFSGHVVGDCYLALVDMSSTVCLSLCSLWAAVVVVVVFSLSVSAVHAPVGRSNNFVSTSHRCGGHRTPRSAELRYAVVIDAGSSGSRARVYQWSDSGRALMSDVKSIEPALAIKTGLATIANSEEAVRDHIQQLIGNASGRVPESHHRDTPIYFMATAGWRRNYWYFQGYRISLTHLCFIVFIIVFYALMY